MCCVSGQLCDIGCFTDAQREVNDMLADMIQECLDECHQDVLKFGEHGMLLSIISCLEQMANALTGGPMESQNKRWGAGLGRLVLEDFNFSESELGTRLLKIADTWSNETKN